MIDKKRLEDIEIAILKLADFVEEGTWNGVYKEIYGILRPPQEEKEMKKP